jgi:hypothetical protein
MNEWRRHPSDPLYLGHYRDGVQIGGYDQRSGVYRSYDAATGIWGAPQPLSKNHGCGCVTECPCDECCCASGKRCTDECTCVAKQQIPNYGVDLDKLNGKYEETLTLNGVPIAKERVWEVLRGKSLADDSGKPRLTIIGADKDCARVLNDLERSPLQDWKDQVLVQSYPPTHWAVTRAGFYAAGHPTIYVQASDGKVLHRQDDYDGGPEALAEAIRRADPKYDPKNDPDLRKLLRLPNPKIPAAAWLLAAGVLYGLIMKGRP